MLYYDSYLDLRRDNPDARKENREFHLKRMKCDGKCFECSISFCICNKNVRFSGFWNFVDKKSNEECWNWKQRCNNAGYGKFSYYGKHFLAHRLSYQFTKGDIPNGMMICHKCDNPACVNPNHLYAGTDKDNSRDRKNRARCGSSNLRKIKQIFNDDHCLLIMKLSKEGLTKTEICERLKEMGLNYNYKQVDSLFGTGYFRRLK
jgi:hypothetical protein